jgi:hypothetical protein
MDENYVQLRDLYIQEQLGELELTPEQREAEFQRIRLLDDDGVRDALEELAGEGEGDEGEDEFGPLEYVASNPDLIAALGGADDPEEAATIHYIEHGFAEGRPIDEFDPEQYLDNYPDLQTAFGGADDPEEAATIHYIEHGFAEGRTYEGGEDEEGPDEEGSNDGAPNGEGSEGELLAGEMSAGITLLKVEAGQDFFL